MLPPQTIGYYCLVAGASMVAGWWVAFRNRAYLGLLGTFFLSLGAALIVYDRFRFAPSPALRWVLLALLGLAAAALLGATVAAVQETRRRLREVREHYQAAAEALLEITRAKEQQLRAKQAWEETPPDQSDEGEQA